jgi:hypothetical protein
MFNFFVIAIFSLLVTSTQCLAGSCTWVWQATIDDEDRFNSAGTKLSTIGQVLAQDRYRYWVELLPDQVEKIQAEAYWEPENLEGNNAIFHYKPYRRSLTEIFESKFNISQADRDIFWTCPKVEVKIRKEGWDCDAEATSSVDITVVECSDD